jgi:hypothetical protein
MDTSKIIIRKDEYKDGKKNAIAYGRRMIEHTAAITEKQISIRICDFNRLTISEYSERE